MTIISEILQHNQSFVREEAFRAYETTKFPDKKLVILTCMDTRLTELLPKAMGLCNATQKSFRMRVL